ncbi:hypothetical protein [Streptomyces sp. NBC_01465]|uniref:hypothetical protein n=1 Tax=Streptomyces sp. NBC_01465 TaxID=2903878 RepID=UPI002E3199E0|nr:hypothetical protein [Streptomyces sp. NBC_01465]
MVHTRTAGRIAIAAALLTAVAVVPAAASTTSSASSSAAHPPAPSKSGSPEVAYNRVADFYGSYIDAGYGEGGVAGGKLSTALRNFYLTPQLRKHLAAWEARNHADGVLRAQNVPRAWKVTPVDSGMGHTWSTVRLTWGSPRHPSYTYLDVQSDLATKKISGIREARR